MIDNLDESEIDPDPEAPIVPHIEYATPLDDPSKSELQIMLGSDSQSEVDVDEW